MLLVTLYDINSEEMLQNKTLMAVDQMGLKILVRSETGATEFVCLDVK